MKEKNKKKNMTANDNRLIDTLKRADVIKEVNHELIWIAPAPAGKGAQ